MSSGSTDRPAAVTAGLTATTARRDDAEADRVGIRPAVPVEPRADVGAATRDGAWSRPVWAARTADDGVGAAPGEPARRRHRWPVAVVAAVLLVAALAGAEAYGRSRLREAVAEQLRASGITGTIDVSVPGGPTPVVLPALLGRGLSRLDIRIRDGQVAGLPVSRADYVLTGLEGDVSVSTGQVHVRSIGDGDVRIEVAPSALADSIGTELVIRDGRLRAGPDELLVETEVDGDSLVLSGPAESLWGAPIEVPIADGYLLPCAPEVSVRRSVVVLACRGSHLPGVLRAPLGLRSGADPDVAPVGSLLPPQSTVVSDAGGSTATVDPAPSAAAPTTAAPETIAPTPAVEPVPTPAPVVPAGPVG